MERRDLPGNLNALKVPELKEILRDLGAPLSGNKEELKKRIQSWTTNGLNRKLVQPVEISVLPIKFPNSLHPIEEIDISHFKSFSLKDLEYWFYERNSQASMEKGRKLFLSKFIKCVSALVGNEYVFISSLCAAETSKKIDYTSQVVININGTVQQCSCSCIAGEGFSAACKHLATLLYCCEHYLGSGVLHQLTSKTSMLQRWHQPPAGRQVEPHTALQLSGSKTIYPVGVPMKYSPSIDDAINISVNYQSKNLLLSVSSTSAQFSIYSDHDYLKSDLKMRTLDMKNTLTDGERKLLELKTRRQSKCIQWWRARKTRITSSLVHRIVSTVRSGKFVTGPAKSILQPRIFSTPSTRWGKTNELKATKAYEELMKTKVRMSGLYVHPTNTFIASSPDGVTEDEIVVIEIKCPFKIRNDYPTSADCLIYKNGNYHLRRNHQFYYQIQTHMYCSGKVRCDFIIWTKKGLFLENVSFNECFMINVVKSLKLYYRKVFCKEVENFKCF